MELPVCCSSASNATPVTLLIGNKQDAQMYRNWPKIVKEARIGEGDISVFTFVRTASPGLKCTVVVALKPVSV